MKSIFITAFALNTALLSIVAHGLQAKEKPNVLFIMVDDLGWKDVGFMGSTYYETPNVDAIAANGRPRSQGTGCGRVHTPES